MIKAFKYLTGYILAAVLLSGCGRLDAVSYAPHITPDEFLRSQPWVQIACCGRDIIWGQPTSTVIVFFVGLFTVYTGIRFLVEAGGQRSRLLWGVGLCLTGVGALCAGVSFQALGYQLKCAGREYCTYTSGWEVAYMLLSVPGMNAFLSASAYSTTGGSFRRAIIAYAVVNTLVYAALLLYGVSVGERFLVSFDLFVLISSPSVLFLLWLHIRAFAQNKSKMDRYLRNGWLIFTAVTAAYFIYLQSGLTQLLWSHHIWFSENDVLHTGMIVWVYYILTRVRAEVADARQN
jgi:hypothetical protein